MVEWKCHVGVYCILDKYLYRLCRLNSKGFDEAKIQELKDKFQMDVKVEDLITRRPPADPDN